MLHMYIRIKRHAGAGNDQILLNILNYARLVEALLHNGFGDISWHCGHGFDINVGVECVHMYVFMIYIQYVLLIEYIYF